MTASIHNVALRIAAIGFVLLNALTPNAVAQPQGQGLSTLDAAQVRTVVQSQLAAFAKDDAVKAFS